MGFFDKLFGSTSHVAPSVDIEQEYINILSTIECLAKAGAEFGKFKFFMYVQYQKNRIVVNLKVGFSDHLQWLRNNPDCLPFALERANLTNDDYDFFIRSLHIRHEDANHDVGEAMFYDDIKNSKHIPALFAAVKKRLVTIPNTYHIIDDTIYSISLHDD